MRVVGDTKVIPRGWSVSRVLLPITVDNLVRFFGVFAQKMSTYVVVNLNTLANIISFPRNSTGCGV
jgi:hypothetical protein